MNPNNIIKKAVLLSAGFGTRLRPITDKLPKCLVPVDGIPLLQRWLDNLVSAGIEEFLINSHYLSEQVHSFIEQSPYSHQITVVYEPELLGTLGTIKESKSFWEGDNILIAHADNLCLCDFKQFFQAFEHRPADCVGTMMLFETDTPQSCGIVELDSSNRVNQFFEKVTNPPSNLANAAIYIFDQHLASYVDYCDIKENDISNHLIPRLLGKLNSWKTDGYLRDIGSIGSLSIANEYMNSRKS